MTEPGRAAARAALAGNPSDGYGGAVLATAVEALAAEAVVEPRGAHRPCPPLVQASISRFIRELAPGLSPVSVRVRTTIPRSVGLGGSSAIVIATLRALCRHAEVTVAPYQLAELALAVEVEELGITAGPQDRIAQSFGGVTFMEFGQVPARVERIDASTLPPLLLAWRADCAEPSGVVHGDLRARWDAGERAVRAGMNELADVARQAREALLEGEHERLAWCLDESFEVRARMLTLNPLHVEMIEVARASGAAANYAGSGGAIVCLCRDPHHREAVALALAQADCETLEVRPQEPLARL